MISKFGHYDKAGTSYFPAKNTPVGTLLALWMMLY